MSQRHSEYARIGRDLYETPAWVTDALVLHLPPRVREIWEPACGGGKIVDALRGHGYSVTGSDIYQGECFLLGTPPTRFDAIVTNPPYEYAFDFIDRALLLTAPNGIVAMLLRTDYDHAQSRTAIFADCRAFAKKIVLTRRIRWFAGTTGSPSFNHAWFIWDFLNTAPPTIAYEPRRSKNAAT